MKDNNYFASFVRGGIGYGDDDHKSTDGESEEVEEGDKVEGNENH